MTAFTGNESNQTILHLEFKNNTNCVPISLCATRGNIADSMLDIDMINQLATHTKHRTTGDSSQRVNVLTVTPLGLHNSKDLKDTLTHVQPNIIASEFE